MIWTWDTTLPRNPMTTVRCIYSFRRQFQAHADHFMIDCDIFRLTGGPNVEPVIDRRGQRYTCGAPWPFLAIMAEGAPVLIAADGVAAFLRFCHYSASLSSDVRAALMSLGSPACVDIDASDTDGRSPVVKVIDTEPLAGFMADGGVDGIRMASGCVYLDDGVVAGQGSYAIFPSMEDRYVGELQDGTRFVTGINSLVEYLGTTAQDVPPELQARYDARDRF